MSQWTHVAGVIRVDGVGFLTGMSPGDEKEALKIIMGEPATYDSPPEVWERTSLPCGSEGSLEYDIQITGDEHSAYRGHIAIWGDLRDFDDLEAIVTWFNTILAQLQPGPNSYFGVRDAVMTIDVEFSGKREILGWNDKQLVRKTIRTMKR